jgi:hypothetical protein
VRRQVVLHAEGCHVIEAGPAQHGPEARTYAWECAGGGESPPYPVKDHGDEANGRFGARSAVVKIDRNEQAARAKVLNMVANDDQRVRKVE